MEFKFNVSEMFPGQIVEINQNLIPPGFTGDRRSLWDAVSKVSEVVNAMGDASASAQGLTKPITTADRLRNSEQTIYLLVDRNAKSGKGVVTGMLKTGKKSLYVFDRDGHHYQVSPPCVLDFYVHESRQRTGLGKQLFEHMLQIEKVEPVKMAIDRPSEKLLSFLDKHYGLNSALRQMNNYVVFDGFFPEQQIQNINGDGSNRDSPSKPKQANGLQGNYTSPYGRYGAPRPPCSMGQIIHNQSPVQSNEPSGVSINQKNTQSAPAVQYQQQINSNQGYPDVCQSAPNVPYQQPMAQPNIPSYGDPNGMQQQAYVCPYSNMQHQYENMQNQQGQTLSTAYYEQPGFQHLQQQKPNVVYNPPNNGISPREGEPAYNENLYFKDPYEAEPVQPHRHVVSQPNLPVHQHQHHQPPVHQISQPQFAQTATPAQYQTEQPANQAHRGDGAGIHQRMATPSQQTIPYQQTLTPQHSVHSHHHTAHSHHHIHPPQMGSPQQPVISQPAAQTHQHVHPGQMGSSQQIVRPQTAVTSHHPEQMLTSPHSHQHVQPQQMGTQQQITRPQSAVPSQHLEQMVSPVPSPHQHYQPQGQVQAQQSYQNVPPQPSTPSHHHVQAQQMVQPQQTAPSQQVVHAQTQEMVTSPPQTVPTQHVEHSHHHTHPQQMVCSPPEAVPTQHQVHTHQMVQSEQPQHPPAIHSQHQHMLQNAQPQSMPVVAPVQHQVTQQQSMPAMQLAQDNVQYQQYVQPPNTEQPVYAESKQDAPAPVKTVPYQYYDSSTATMQSRYLHPHASASQTPRNVYSQQLSQAAGDMSTMEKTPEDQKGRSRNRDGITTFGEIVSARPPRVHTRRKIGQDTVSGLLHDASGQMSTDRRHPQGHQWNGEQHKALDDSVGQSPKLERPRSLSIQRSEEAENVDKKISNDVKSGVHYKEPEKKSKDELDNIENDVEKVEIAESAPKVNAASENGSDDSESRSKSPNPLTAQGFFDLKFYHSRLW